MNNPTIYLHRIRDDYIITRENEKILTISKEIWKKLTEFKKNIDKLFNSSENSKKLSYFEKEIISISKKDWNQLNSFKRAEIYRRYLEFKKIYGAEVKSL